MLPFPRCSSDMPPIRVMAGQRSDGDGPTSREDIVQEAGHGCVAGHLLALVNSCANFFCVFCMHGYNTMQYCRSLFSNSVLDAMMFRIMTNERFFASYLWELPSQMSNIHCPPLLVFHPSGLSVLPVFLLCTLVTFYHFSSRFSPFNISLSRSRHFISSLAARPLPSNCPWPTRQNIRWENAPSTHEF